ncbi:hypothetical protein HQ305_10520 [Rhodococcus sp. BP-149]|nr:hypothetical protein ASG69_05895 [Rhodococcus sp. Leaf225]KQU44550.1 hypothetical protein ASH03_11245 [Rhodococcus sp. Leaf258]MBY6686047.1 hypothetical protein [Rhodococcus sp. BP-288]MBY6696118.1 hypothetical protein [Rhodococcus sp. BP-188]MBY6700715.1 hypothetical protein [Rhodococcus sp. BP-285]MBY6703219.1 hypothetical protein [Rhodococcus sp. BP-283]MBY6711201.1 hypothetical protein [Rhodococcus sp. BP-160]MBY6717588.1 hypothetical protein [Rhodococcus sp. BP-110]MBY6722159.1 hypo
MVALLRRSPLLTVRALAALGLVLSLLVACSPSAPDEQTPTTTAGPDARTVGVTALLDSWTAALRSDDEAALRELIDSDADPGFADREIARAQALRGLPLSDFGYEITPGPETPVPVDRADALAATEVWAPNVALRYAWADADIGSTSRDIALVVARRGDTWRLVSDADLPQYGRTTWRGPWDFGPVVTERVATGSTTSLVVGHEAQRAFIDDLAAELPSAVAAVTEFAGLGWSRRAVLTVTGSDAEFISAADGFTSTDVAASTIADPVRGGLVTGQRIVFGPTAPDRLTDSTRRTVLRHELTHVAMRAVTGEDAPLWMLEGFADYSGYRGSGLSFDEIAPTLAAVVRAAGPPRVLPEDSDFAAGGSRGSIAYESAWSVASFVADRFGEPVLRQLYDRFAAGPTDPTVTDSVFSATLGFGTVDFLAQWGQWVAEQAAGQS